MDYKKILILLLSIINILVLALLIKPIETKEDFNDTCSPPDDQ